MKGNWIQDAGEVWHLEWHLPVDAEKDTFYTWCNKKLKGDSPRKSGGQIDFMDICHDECVRQSEVFDA